jgi:hypothetical protein
MVNSVRCFDFLFLYNQLWFSNKKSCTFDLKLEIMGVLQKQYILDDHGNNVGVVISFTEYQALMERIDELEDIIAYDKAKKEISDPMPFDTFLKELENQA